MSLGDLSTGFGDHDDSLYPPDADVVTPDDRSRRARAALGTALVVVGCSLLAERVFEVSLHFGLFAAGAAALAGWLQVRRYAWFVVGAVLAGAGVGSILEGLFGGPGVMLASLGAALGFLVVFVRYPRRSTWALVAAAAAGILAAMSAGVALLGLLPHVATASALPLVVIAAGVLLLLRGRVPSPIVKVGITVLAVVFLVLLGAKSPR